MKGLSALVAALLFAAVAFANQADAALTMDRSTLENSTTSMTMFLGPSSQTINAGNTATFSLNWSGYATFDEGFTIVYGDGANDGYRCWSNCFSGSTTFWHVYNSSGTFFPQVVDDYGAWSNVVTVNVN